MTAPLDFLGILYTTPRVGQNAVLRSLRPVFPRADEWGATGPDDNNRMVVSINRPPPVNAWDHLDLSVCRFGRPVMMLRRDRVAQAISWALAAQTGQFLSTTEARGVPEYRREDVQNALTTIYDQERRWGEQHDTRGALTIWYEDHVADDPRVAARKILDWWEFDGEPAVPDLKRIDQTAKAEWRRLWDAGL